MIKTIKKLMYSQSREDNMLGLEYLAKYILEHGTENFNMSEEDFIDGYFFLKDFKTGIIDRKENVFSRSVGLATKHFSLNLGGWHVVYAPKHSTFYKSALSGGVINIINMTKSKDYIKRRKKK